MLNKNVDTLQCTNAFSDGTFVHYLCLSQVKCTYIPIFIYPQCSIYLAESYFMFCFVCFQLTRKVTVLQSIPQ